MTACQEDFTTTVVQTAKVWTYQQSEFRKQLRKVLNVWKQKDSLYLLKSRKTKASTKHLLLTK